MNRLCISLLNLLINFWKLSYAIRGKRIDIYAQNGGDIVQLKPNMGLPLGVMFNALPQNSPYKWTRYKDSTGTFILPYIITGKFDSEEKETIAGAMYSIEKNTCLRFKPKSDEEDFLDLQNRPGQGCYTTVGRMPGRNVVMLESNNIATCIDHDIVIHELMHTIGLWHEHMRYDRDDYIKVHYENIDPIYNNQFEKVSPKESTTYGIKYDYKSVMHYARDAFSKRPGITTMETLDKSFQDIIGHVPDASPSDYLKICSIYNCSTCMGQTFDISMLNSTLQNSTFQPQAYTRATRYPPMIKITPSPPPNLPTRDPTMSVGELPAITYPPDCPDEWFCINMIVDWNRKMMCAMPWVQKWCCNSCKDVTRVQKMRPRMIEI